MTASRAVVRQRWHGRDVLSYPARPPTILHVLDDAVAVHGDREGFVDARERVTYAEFADRVAGTAAELADHGLTPGSALGVVATNSIDLAVLVFAAAAAGVVLVGLSSRGAPPRWASLLRSCGATRIATDGDAANAAAALGDDHAAVITLAALARARTAPWQPPTGDENATFAVVGTAGTTGTPKASRVIHRCSVHSALSYADVLGLTSADRTAVLFPLTYISALHAHVLPTMLAGGANVLTADARPHRYGRLLADEQISWMYTVPSLWLSLLRLDGFTAAGLPDLRLAAFGGGPFPPDALADIRRRLPGVRLHNVYGLSETHSPATILRDHEFAARPTSVGRPLPCMEARVVDSHGELVGPGVAGQLHLRGSLVTTGYVGAPTATAATFDDDGWFATGDHARMDAEGYVWILGRRTDLIVRGGFNIAPVEVERALRRLRGVADAAVYGVPTRIGDAAVACTVVRTDATVTTRAVRDWVRRQVADYAVPRHVWFADSLPLTPLGKLDRRALVAVALGKVTTP